MNYASSIAIRRSRSLALWLSLGLATACGGKGKTPPPVVDDVVTPTSLESQTIRGSAAQGSTITLAGGSAAPVTTTTDHFTARWEAVVPLMVGKNDISVTATDATGNVSDATVVSITRDPVHPQALEVRLSRSLLSADDASLVAHVRATAKEAVALAGLAVQVAVISSTDGGVPAPVSATLDANGEADATVTGLTTPGMGVIEVTAPASPGLRARADFLVNPGRPADVSLGLASCGSRGTPGPALSIVAGGDACATITVKDQPRNVLLDAPVTLYTDAPAAMIEGGRLTNLTRAGTFRVVAVVSGTLLSSVATLSISPSDPAVVALSPSSVALRAGEAVTFTASVSDAFGNAVDAGVAFASNADAGVTFTGPSTFAFCGLGAVTVSAQVGTSGPSGAAHATVAAGPAVGVALSTTPSPAVVRAGQPVSFTTSTLDSCGNPTADLVVTTTNAPGAFVAGGTIGGLTRAGAWAIEAQVAGSNVYATTPLTVGADATTTVLALAPTSHAAFVGVPLAYSVGAVDGFGNPVPGTPTISVAPDASAVVDTALRSITFDAAGTQTVTAKLGSAQVSDFVVVTRRDIVPPTVSITAPATGSAFAPGTLLTATIAASDDVALAEVSLNTTGVLTDFQTQLAPVATASTTFTFNVPVPAGAAVGPVSLVARAVDTSGNRTLSTRVNIVIDPAAAFTLAGGFTASTVSSGNLLVSPVGIAERFGTIYVASSGSGRIISISPNGAQTVLAQVARPVGLAYAGATDAFYVTSAGSNQVSQVSPAGATTPFTNTAGAPMGIVFDGANLWTVGTDNFVRRYSLGSSTPTCMLDWSGNGLAGAGWGLAFESDGSMVVTNGLTRVLRITGAEVAAGCRAVPFAVPFFASQVAGGRDVSAPEAIVRSASGLLYYANSGNGRIMRIDPFTGNAVTVLASGLQSPEGLAFDGTGALLVTDSLANAVYRIIGPF